MCTFIKFAKFRPTTTSMLCGMHLIELRIRHEDFCPFGHSGKERCEFLDIYIYMK